MLGTTADDKKPSWFQVFALFGLMALLCVGDTLSGVLLVLAL